MNAAILHVIISAFRVWSVDNVSRQNHKSSVAWYSDDKSITARIPKNKILCRQDINTDFRLKHRSKSTVNLKESVHVYTGWFRLNLKHHYDVGRMTTGLLYSNYAIPFILLFIPLRWTPSRRCFGESCKHKLS